MKAATSMLRLKSITSRVRVASPPSRASLATGNASVGGADRPDQVGVLGRTLERTFLRAGRNGQQHTAQRENAPPREHRKHLALLPAYTPKPAWLIGI